MIPTARGAAAQIKVKCCFPLTIIPGIGRCATKVGRLVGCPEYNPCCVATILLKPILAPLGTPLLLRRRRAHAPLRSVFLVLFASVPLAR